MLSIIRSLAVVCLALTLLGTVRVGNAHAISHSVVDASLATPTAVTPAEPISSSTQIYTDTVVGFAFAYPLGFTHHTFVPELDMESSTSFYPPPSAGPSYRDDAPEVAVTVYDKPVGLSLNTWETEHANPDLAHLPAALQRSAALFDHAGVAQNLEVAGHLAVLFSQATPSLPEGRLLIDDGARVISIAYPTGADPVMKVAFLTIAGSFAFGASPINAAQTRASINAIVSSYPLPPQASAPSRQSRAATAALLGYKLPWPTGVSHTVMQGCCGNGTVSHFCPGQACSAYDFTLDIGTDVVASRGGVVTDATDYYTQCGGSAYENLANRVTIQHDDGTSTAYLHLSRVDVSVNQVVHQGEHIGLSGDVGMTYFHRRCWPHLHFQRQDQGIWITQSRWVAFDEYPGQQLYQGNSYTSHNGSPGRPTPTDTPQPTPTDTSRPTATRTNTPHPTSTSAPRPTSTPRPTNTPAATATRLPTLTPRPTYTPVPTNTPTIPAPGAWTFCAAEGGACSFPSTQAVAFGANGHFAYGVFTGSISCATGPFGDPAPGNSKACYTSATLTPPAPGPWTLCAGEGGNCSFSGTQAVAFGADGRFAYGVYTNGASCNTSFGDPAPGTSKSCYTSTTLTPPAPGIWTPCATEGGNCGFSGTRAVAFGADGHFAYGVYSGGAPCNTSFGNPAPGTPKACYTSTTLTPPAPGIWTPCAGEGGTCSFSGTQAVAFGANGHFAYGVYTGSALCNTGFGDPAPGASKSCYTSTTLTPPAPGAWTFCSTEGKTCSFSRTQAVAFGANGHFAYGVFTGSALCNTGFGDPAPGASKGCYTSTTLTPPAPGAWTLCATEGGNCGFSGTQAVAFGADGHFAYGVFTGGAPCNTGFGDPAPGTSKSCYTSATLTPSAPGPWTPCASEGGTCSFSGTQAVAFGTDGHFAYGVYTGGVACDTGFGDPTPGTPKACYTSTTLPPAPTPTAGPTQSALAIDSGGGAAGNFVADTDVTGGTTIYSTSNTIDTSGVTNPAPQAVYQTERSGSDFTYTIPALRPNASYLVRLHFAEFAFNGPGIRLFNVTINGQQVLTNFDIYAAAGGQNKAVVEPFLATADGSGAITIEYVNVAGGAKSSGIEVLSAPPLAINSGGGAVGRFVGDTDVTGGTTMYSTTNAIDTSGVTNPAPQAVYQTERSGNNFTYTIPGLNPGTPYTVRLHFAEWAFSSPGVRLFNVTINDQQVLTNFDIYATAGGQNKAVVEQFTTTANSSGQIVITYINVSGGAKSSGIEILPAS